MTPLMRRNSTSDNPSLIQLAIGRFWEYREHRQFIRWETLSDSADSTYEAHVTGNPNIRASRVHGDAVCAGLCDGPYFAPDPQEWADFHVGGKKPKGPAPAAQHPQIEVTLEAEQKMSTALRLWFLLDHPQYADICDLELFQDQKPVTYAKQGRDFALEMNSTRSFHQSSRKEIDAHRSRVREGKVHRDEKQGDVCFKKENST